MAKATPIPSADEAGDLYGRDFYAWTRRTADRLRQRRFEEVDLDLAAEEIEDMGKREAKELRSRMRVLLTHLLKWQFQPEHRSRSWRTTIVTQRQEIADTLQQSPSLRRHAKAELPTLYGDAVDRAATETGLAHETFPRTCPYTLDQTLDRTFFPE